MPGREPPIRGRRVFERRPSRTGRWSSTEGPAGTAGPSGQRRARSPPHDRPVGATPTAASLRPSPSAVSAAVKHSAGLSHDPIAGKRLDPPFDGRVVAVRVQRRRVRRPPDVRPDRRPPPPRRDEPHDRCHQPPRTTRWPARGPAGCLRGSDRSSSATQGVTEQSVHPIGCHDDRAGSRAAGRGRCGAAPRRRRCGPTPRCTAGPTASRAGSPASRTSRSSSVRPHSHSRVEVVRHARRARSTPADPRSRSSRSTSAARPARRTPTGPALGLGDDAAARADRTRPPPCRQAPAATPDGSSARSSAPTSTTVESTRNRREVPPAGTPARPRPPSTPPERSTPGQPTRSIDDTSCSRCTSSSTSTNGHRAGSAPPGPARRRPPVAYWSAVDAAPAAQTVRVRGR